MAQLGTAEWVRELDGVLRDVEPAADLVVQYELDDTGDAWFVELTAGAGAHARSGRHHDPDVTLRAPLAVVAAVNAGERSALAAFYDGDLRFRGDLRRLGPAAAALAALPRVPAEA